MIRAAVTAAPGEAEELRARFIELVPEGFEELEHDDAVELAAYGEAAERVRLAFPAAAVTEIADGWEDGWRAFHRPVRIGRLWVGPPWETAPEDALTVVIDPGRAFGTGAHPSTRLSLELLLGEERGSLVDVGCGSGVISIAAGRLGFAPLLAVDIDEVAVEVTRANAAANGVELRARCLDVRDEALPAADVAVANISLELVRVAAERLSSPRLITAGYLASDPPGLPGFDHRDRRSLDGWAADLYERRD